MELKYCGTFNKKYQYNIPYKKKEIKFRLLSIIGRPFNAYYTRQNGSGNCRFPAFSLKFELSLQDPVVPPCIFYFFKHLKGDLKLLESSPVSGCPLELNMHVTTRCAEPSVTVVLTACRVQEVLSVRAVYFFLHPPPVN